MANSERRHPDEDALVKFLARPDQDAGYVRDTAGWIKKEYPGSAGTLLPRLRQVYRNKRIEKG